MQLFYSPTLTIEDDYFCFDKNESRHIIKVLRKKIGDNILITNGLGYIFESEISQSNPNKCEIKILSFSQQNKRDYKIHLAVAPTKLNERYEWFLEKATEIGVDEITPIFCSNSERKVIKSERYKKVIHAAAKQSKQAYFPKLNTPQKFKDLIQNSTASHRYIAHCMDGRKLHLKTELKSKKDILILIGPEGDFTTQEIEWANRYEFQAISLGDSRLRTETAAIVACHTIHLCYA